MNIILLSGGSGKRLWPLSNDIRSKQFLKIFRSASKDGDLNAGKVKGPLESMVQRVYRQIKAADTNAVITIATSKAQVSAIQNQIGKDVDISIESCRRDTFPAIALASAYLTDVKGLDSSETVVVCPVDPYVENDYFQFLVRLSELAEKSESNLVLMGIEPTYPSEKYGYIIPSTTDKISDVITFKEKPDIPTAESCIKQGALWNSGVFAYRLSYVLNKSKEMLGYYTYEELYSNYESLPKISFDYAVVEKEPKISVLRFERTWKDIGTWNTLVEVMDSDIIGDGRVDESSSNVHILNELDVPILAMGVHDVVISASPEGVLVSDLNSSSHIKPYVDAIHQPVKFAEKSWGSYKVIDVGEESLVVKVVLNPNHHMNYHSHERRDEVWTVVNGSGTAIIEGMEQIVCSGDVVTMAAGCRHTIIAGSEGLKLIEIQVGKEISASDKRKYDIDF